MTRRRSILVYSLVVLGTLVLLISSVTVWTKRQALNTDNWTKASGQVLADPTVRQALSVKLVDLLYQQVDVTKELEQVLPKQAKGAAPAAAAALQTAAVRAVDALLATPQAQQLWENANRRAHTAIINVLEGKDIGPVSTADGAVVLDLRPLLERIQGRLGLSGKFNTNTSPTAGEIVLLRPDQLKTAQDGVKLVHVLSSLLILVSLVIYGLAIYLAHPKRRVVLEVCGASFIFAGVLLLILRRVLGNIIVNDLVKTDSQRPVVHVVWLILTQLLRDIAFAGIAYGILAIIAGWIAGPSRPATWVRRSLAPTFRERPVVVFLIAALVILLVVAWGPTAASHSLLGILVFALLLGFGLEVLRRQTIREFPPTTSSA
jgi:hypothetical protein